MMRHDSKIRLALAILAVGLLLIPTAGQTADFPKGPITLVVPWGAGGATDVTFRALGEATKDILGQPIIVENRVGGGSAVGVGSIVGKKADGHTLCEATSSLHRNSCLNKLPFDTVKDLTPITMVGGHLFGILVRADSPFKTLNDVIEYAKANPGKLTYMASGVGSGGHIAWEETAYNAGGVQVQHIPSKGDQESSTALLGGHVDMIATSGGWVPLVQAGKLRLLATFGKERSEIFPDVPTVKELGLKVVHDNLMVILGPKGMDPKVVKTLQDAFHKAQKDPRFVSAMGSYGMPILYMDTQECMKYWTDSYKEAQEQVAKFILKK
ncbi:MAG: tripartite tricarboxylate transporter substrate binding protein [Desulfomonile tiedjei]|nr:tripartite tricarboxylate transporter substrate binding protein [Desulfomonile tiedjei]